MKRVFANDPGNRGSIPGRIIPKTHKWYLMPLCLTLSIITYGSRVKWGNPEKRVAPSPTPLYQVLPHRSTEDLGAMAIKGYSAFPKTIGLSSGCLMSYPGHSLRGESYPSAEMQSVYSTAQADCANLYINTLFNSYGLDSTTTVLLHRWIWH